MFRALLVSYVFFISVSLYAQNGFQDVVVNEKAHYSRFHSSKRSSRNSAANFNIIYHRLRLEPSLKNGYLKGSVFTRFITKTAATVIDLDLRQEMLVDSVIFHGTPAAFTHNNQVLKITVPSMPSGHTDSVEVFYQGFPSNAEGSYTFMDHANVPVVFTLSEPYGAHYWWPCKESLNDKTDSVDCYVLVDTGMLAAGNGLLVSRTAANDSQEWFHWKHRYPIATYLVAFAVTNYRQFSDFAPVARGTRQVEVLNYVYPEYYNDAVLKGKATAGMISLYDSLFGTYPFSNEKYGHAQFSRNGGMEHQTMSFMGHLNFDLVAHELGHQWFGDQATCGSWQELWLNEGFATYLNLLCYRYLRTNAEWQNILRYTRDDVLSQPDGSVFVTDTADVGRLFDSRLTYNKGAMLLHMLRWKIGSDSFYKGLQNYLKDPSVNYGFGRTAKLKAHLEAVYGKSLDTFFNNWYYGQGYPTYFLKWRQRGRNLSVIVTQRTSHSSVSFFPMPLEVMFTDANNHTFTTVLDVTDTAQTFNFQLPFQASSLVFDPNTWLLAKSEIVNLGISEAPAFDIYPNPVRDELNIGLNKESINKIRLIDMTGKLVYEKTYPSPLSMGNTEKIPLKSVANGVYLIELSGEGAVYKQKILKQ